MRGEWNTQYIAVSPIRGGSLPAADTALSDRISFPHTRGKFTYITIRVELPNVFPPYAGEVYYNIIKPGLIYYVSPIRGGSLPLQDSSGSPLYSFPHTRGKFTSHRTGARREMGFPHTRGKFTWQAQS